MFDRGVVAKRLVWAVVTGIALLMILPAASMLGAAAMAGPRAAEDSSSLLAASSAASPSTGTAVEPLTPVTAPSTTNLLSGLSPSLLKIPWIASLAHTGPSLRPLTSLPNLALLEHPVHPDAQGTINPFYVAQPAPLGLGDFGLGATPYSYNTSHIMGEVTFAAPPNVTDPDSAVYTEPSGEHDGYVGSVYEFGIQLNTVATNISIPGSDQGFFWTQNVINFNDTGIHFVDDTFNMSGPPEIEPGTIYSACGNNSVGVQKILNAYGGVFQCVGGTIPISPASYPITIQLYNNATVTAGNRTEVAYGYRFVFSGTGQVFTGLASDVIFNNPTAATSRPANVPGFSIDGFEGAPGGIFRDAEIVLVGNIGGDNSVFRSVQGTINLEYTNLTHGGWQNVPSAYNFGTDTGETSTGIADFWTPSHTLDINQGPAMLYGLWNSQPQVAVASGSIHISGSIKPSYGFVFVGNTPPVLDPWNSTLGERDNMSWLPTNNAGKFSTYLPPLGAPWTSSYYVQGFADGYATENGTPITGSVSAYTLDLSSSPGTLDAPLYAFSNAQEAALALHVTGSSVAPYDFSGLTVNMNLSFEHVNDYGFPEFSVFMSQGVTNPIEVNAVFQGTDSPSGNFVIIDYPIIGFESGLLAPAPFTFEAFYYTSGVEIFGGIDDQVANQIVAGDGYNLQILLWGDRDAQVWNVTSTYGSMGVFVGDSFGTSVWNVDVTNGATGISDVGSTGTYGWDVLALGPGATGVYALSSHDASFWSIGAWDGAAGLVSGAFDNPASGGYPYYWLPGSSDLTLTDVVAYNQSLGANVSLSTDVSVSDVSATLHSTGVLFALTTDASATYVTAKDHSEAVGALESSALLVAHVLDRGHSTGVVFVDSSHSVIEDVLAELDSVGVILDGATHIVLNNIRATGHSIAIEVL